MTTGYVILSYLDFLVYTLLICFSTLAMVFGVSFIFDKFIK